jgi:allantoinase
MNYEHGLLPAWNPAPDSGQRLRWPGGKRLAFWLAPNIEYYEIAPAPNAVRPAWPRPFPDMQNWSWRDYGNRVGVWRCLEVFDRHSLTGSVSLNSAMCRHFPEIVQEFVDRGWELFSHGEYNTQYLFARSPEDERAHLQASCDEIARFGGKPVRGLLSPALTYTESTLESAIACGLDYVLDVCASEEVLPMKLQGHRLLAVPYSLELNDFFAVVAGGLSAHAYLDRFKQQFDRLARESEVGNAKVIGLPLHPYLIGMPQYVWALDQMLAHVRAHDDIVWNARAADIADCFAQHSARQGAELS